MPRRIAETPPYAEILLTTGEHAPSVEEKVRYVRDLRAQSREIDLQLDNFMVQQIAQQHQGLLQAQEQQKEFKELVDKLFATPWHPALFLRLETTPVGERALVNYNGSRRVVAISDQSDSHDLRPGDEVFLNQELNFIVAKSQWGAPRFGETAVFERYTEDRRLVLKQRDDEVVVDAGPLQNLVLRKGERVRWERAGWIALERVPADEGRELLLDEVPNIGRDKVGGQDANLETLISTLIPILSFPDKAKNYGLGGRRSILLVGPSGTGKTLMARIAASEVAAFSGVNCRFGVVKPAEWESPWVGETQANIRKCFKALKEAAENGFAVLFLDEIEAIGRIRGGAVGQHSDKFLAAFLAELDGFAHRGNVAIIAATNRKDMVDPALLERLSDVEIEVKRPDLQGARAIFGIHLPETVPYHSNGKAATHTRSEIIESAVTRFYSPNAGENEISVLRFRDGKRRVVAARELASGRLFEQICRAARQAAFMRDIRGGEQGLCVNDIADAVSNAIQRLGSTLSVHNARAYLHDLPQDVDVVSAEPVVRRAVRAHRYLNVA
jgi:proteasome-associated ATPase